VVESTTGAAPQESKVLDQTLARNTILFPSYGEKLAPKASLGVDPDPVEHKKTLLNSVPFRVMIEK
jgi:hypothetical protein